MRPSGEAKKILFYNYRNSDDYTAYKADVKAEGYEFGEDKFIPDDAESYSHEAFANIPKKHWFKIFNIKKIDDLNNFKYAKRSNGESLDSYFKRIGRHRAFYLDTESCVDLGRVSLSYLENYLDNIKLKLVEDLFVNTALLLSAFSALESFLSNVIEMEIYSEYFEKMTMNW